MNSIELLQEFLANPFDDSDLYGTPEERKAKNKQANIDACGKMHSQVIWWDGSLKHVVNKCRYYRECEAGCREEKYEELEKRINHAQAGLDFGQRLFYDRVTHKERQAYCKQLYRNGADYLSLPQPNDEYIIIHDGLDGEGDELWEVGYDENDEYNEDNGLDLNFYFILKNVPEGRKISGNLGKPKEEEKEGNGQGPEDEEKEEAKSIKIPHLYKPGLSERDANMAYKLALAKTLDIKVTNEIELEKALFARINEMAEQISGATVYFNWSSVTEADIALWNANPNNFSRSEDVLTVDLNKDVQISTNKEYTSRNLDKRKPLVERIIDRATDDELKQEAIRDFLKQNYAN